MGIEEEIRKAGAEIIWVLEKDIQTRDGTASGCAELLRTNGNSDAGYCVGDYEMSPVPGAFDTSPFTAKTNRGFDMIVNRRTMKVVWVSSHGSVPGNENPTPQEVLAAVELAVKDARALP